MTCSDFFFDAIALEEGWDDATQIAVLLRYIGNQGSDDAFADFLNEQRAEPLDGVMYEGRWIAHDETGWLCSCGASYESPVSVVCCEANDHGSDIAEVSP
jgi:hypothetical protein